MKEHAYFENQLPFYATGQLEGPQLVEIETHLATCHECSQNLELWQAVSDEIGTIDHAVAAPKGLADRALAQIGAESKISTSYESGFTGMFLHAVQLLRAQVLLTRREMWPSTAAVMALGVITALLSKHAEAVYFIAPAIAIASIAELTGRGNDPAYEMVLATPTSPWKVLLARLSVISGYCLLLSLLASLALLAFVPPALLGTFILGWLGPLAFLSALALFLSLWLGTANAVAITYILWIAQFIPYQSIQSWMASPILGAIIRGYQEFWHNPIMLCLLSIVVVGAALVSADRAGLRLSQETA